MSGTCWSFAGTSLLESECIRKSGEAPDLSEMYAVRNAYRVKARNYILRQGTARFTEGGLIHDVLISAAAHGLVTEASYSGLTPGRTVHDHREMFKALDPVVKRFASPSNQSGNGWRREVDEVLDAHLGAPLADLGGKGPHATSANRCERTPKPSPTLLPYATTNRPLPCTATDRLGAARFPSVVVLTRNSSPALPSALNCRA